MNRCFRSALVCSLVLGSGAVFGGKPEVNKGGEAKTGNAAKAATEAGAAVRNSVDAKTGKVKVDGGANFVAPIKPSGALSPDHRTSGKPGANPFAEKKSNPFTEKPGAPVLTKAKPSPTPSDSGRKAAESSLSEVKSASAKAFIDAAVKDAATLKKTVDAGKAVEALKFGDGAKDVIARFGKDTMSGVLKDKLVELDALLKSSKLSDTEKDALRASVGLFLADVKGMEGAAQQAALDQLKTFMDGFAADLKDPETASSAAKFMAGALAYFGKDPDTASVHLETALKKWADSKSDPDARAGLVALYEAAAKSELKYVTDFFTKNPDGKLDHNALWKSTEQGMLSWAVARLKANGVSDAEVQKMTQDIMCSCNEHSGGCDLKK
jgi:hypothetical protein